MGVANHSVILFSHLREFTSGTINLVKAQEEVTGPSGKAIGAVLLNGYDVPDNLSSKNCICTHGVFVNFSLFFWSGQWQLQRSIIGQSADNK